MSDIRTAFPSKYLRAADIAAMPNGTARLKIAALEFEMMKTKTGEEESKPILYFEKAKKGIVLNKTNSDRIAGSYGWETDLWIGHVVELYVAEVSAFGETVDAIRVRIPKAAPPAARAAAPQRHTEPMQEPPEDGPEPGDLDGDEIPF